MELFSVLPLPQNLLFHIIEVLWHLPSPCLREEHGEGPGGDGHHGEDEGGDGGVDVSQGGHGGGQSASDLKLENIF